jgi:hypothetical protein
VCRKGDRRGVGGVVCVGVATKTRRKIYRSIDMSKDIAPKSVTSLRSSCVQTALDMWRPIMITSARISGPFVHCLNKGGLEDIVRTRKLRGTVASNSMANDRPAVRAYTGTFEHQKRNKNWNGPQMTVIEFYTSTPPRPNLSPGYAEWTEEGLVDGHLSIQISKIVDGNGAIIPAAHYRSR